MRNDPESSGELIPEWDFGDKLRKVRRIVKLTQAEFAARLSVKENTYNSWESSRNVPSLTDAQAIANRLRMMCGVPQWWLLGLESQNPHPGGPGGGVTTQLPRLDSNQQPFDSRIEEGAEAQIITFPAPPDRRTA